MESATSDIFRALADPSRRLLLDLLFETDGRSLSDLAANLDMGRFGVMKHLNVLEKAGLISTKKVGREKLHYLNPVPIQQIHDRWVSKYTQPWASALVSLKKSLESDFVEQQKPQHVYRTFIRTTPEQLWQAITSPEMTVKYFYHSRVVSDWKPDSEYIFFKEKDGERQISGKILECDPPKRLVTTFTLDCYEHTADEAPSRITWEIEQSAKIPGVCILTVIHDHFDGASKTYEEVGNGWPWILSGLKTVLETGHAIDDRQTPYDTPQI